MTATHRAPSRSLLGVSLTLAAATALAFAGLLLAVTHPALSGATAAAVLLICAAGAVLVRLAWCSR